jgi:hypothetical protein
LAASGLNGRQMVDVLNAVGLDIAVLGNHEFDIGRDAFLARMNEARFVVIAANVTDSAGRPFPKVLPHAIRTVRAGGRDIRVAFLGVVIPSNRPSWSRVTDPLEAARREAALLRDSAGRADRADAPERRRRRAPAGREPRSGRRVRRATSTRTTRCGEAHASRPCSRAMRMFGRCRS